jgi:hypothetical protein
VISLSRSRLGVSAPHHFLSSVGQEQLLFFCLNLFPQFDCHAH